VATELIPDEASTVDADVAAQPLIEVQNLCKVFGEGENAIVAVDHVTLRIDRGEFVAFVGPSGSGKTTLMNTLGCLDRPTSGLYRLNGVDVSELSDLERARMRLLEIGFVFQSFNLLPRLTALENVELPLVYAGVRGEARHRRAERTLRIVGLGDRMDHRPSELSGGQQQRVAMARALVNGPELILADEPTGQLDTRTTLEVMDMLSGLHRQGISIVLVTHEPDVAAYAGRTVAFRDGAVVDDKPNPPRLSPGGVPTPVTSNTPV